MKLTRRAIIKAFNKTMTALTVVGLLAGGSVTTLAGYTKVNNKPFAGVVVEGIVDVGR